MIATSSIVGVVASSSQRWSQRNRVSLATNPIAQRDQRRQLERFTQIELADLPRLDLRDDEVPRSRARRKAVLACPWEVVGAPLLGPDGQQRRLYGIADLGHDPHGGHSDLTLLRP